MCQRTHACSEQASRWWVSLISQDVQQTTAAAGILLVSAASRLFSALVSEHPVTSSDIFFDPNCSQYRDDTQYFCDTTYTKLQFFCDTTYTKPQYFCDTSYSCLNTFVTTGVFRGHWAMAPFLLATGKNNLAPSLWNPKYATDRDTTQPKLQFFCKNSVS